MPRTVTPRYRLRGENAAQVSGWALKVMMAVACPRCRANKGWICTTANGRPSATAHAARNEAYAALTAGQA